MREQGKCVHKKNRVSTVYKFLLKTVSTYGVFVILQLEDNWEQEKKIRAEVEKARRKAEGDLKMTIENLNEMERSKIDLEEVVKKYVCF